MAFSRVCTRSSKSFADSGSSAPSRIAEVSRSMAAAQSSALASCGKVKSIGAPSTSASAARPHARSITNRMAEWLPSRAERTALRMIAVMCSRVTASSAAR
jgi:hypothetical protein